MVEGKQLATALLLRGSDDEVDQAAGARLARDRFLVLIVRRVAKVRRIARYVFRAHPDIVRDVTSAYLRDRRRAYRQAENEPVILPKDPAPIDPDPTPD